LCKNECCNISDAIFLPRKEGLAINLNGIKHSLYVNEEKKCIFRKSGFFQLKSVLSTGLKKAGHANRMKKDLVTGNRPLLMDHETRI
jgi:hypothetical protein